jgi:hypothetical protein
VRVACVTLLLLIATGLAVLFEYEIYEAGRPMIEGKSDKEVFELCEQIQNGMTRREVAALLGPPRYIQQNGPCERWRYQNGCRYLPVFCNFLEVCFSAEGKVVDKYCGD